MVPTHYTVVLVQCCCSLSKVHHYFTLITYRTTVINDDALNQCQSCIRLHIYSEASLHFHTHALIFSNRTALGSRLQTRLRREPDGSVNACTSQTRVIGSVRANVSAQNFRYCHDEARRLRACALQSAWPISQYSWENLGKKQTIANNRSAE